MAAALLPLIAGSAGLQAIGSIMQGISANQAAHFNADVSDRNAIITNQNAAQSATAQAQQAAMRIGAARAGYAKGGVRLDEGSPLTVLEDSARAAELDRQTILYNGRVQAQGYTDQAKLDRYTGNAAQTSGYIGAASSLLKGGEDAIQMGATFGAGSGYSLPGATP